MKTFGTLIAALVMIVVALGVWAYTLVDRASLRYRLTYEVVVPSGEIKSGSSVVQVDWEDTTRLPLPNTGGGNTVTGEAAVVDLGQGKYLFSLLKGVDYKGNPNELIHHAFRPLVVSSPRMELIEFIRHLDETKPKTRLDSSQLPLLVTFTDINDPKSMKRVDPNDLAASFGAGYQLKSVILEVTDEPVTKGKMESLLEWLSRVKGRIKPTDKEFERDLLPEEKLYRLDFRRN